MEQGSGNREHDRWASGSAYEAYVGRWSRQVAREFLGWLGAATGRRWLDVGCGTGALARTIIEQTDPKRVVGVEPSSDFLAFAREETIDLRAQFVGGDGTAIPLADGACDYTVSGLVLNFVPDPPQMVAEMARVARPGGTVAVYVWDYADEMQMMRHFWDAVVELDPVARRFDEGTRFAICNQESLAALFDTAGLRGVESKAVDIPTHFVSFDDYWTPFTGGTGAAPGYVASLEEADRIALRERLRERLPIRADGSIELIARAWAVRGLRA